MRGTLNDEQIDYVLYTQVLGRIACYQNRKLYVVPITYAYENGYIYGHSQEGMKIKMMRKNPSVCFEVDVIENMVNWRSVIAWGRYEEIEDEQAQQDALRILTNRLTPILNSQSIEPLQVHGHPPEIVNKPKKAVVFRIVISQKTGRYEKSPGGG